MSKQPTRLIQREQRTTRVPKAVLNRLSRLLAEAQAAQLLGTKAAEKFAEACGTALEAFGYEPELYSIHPQTGEITPIPAEKAAPAPAQPDEATEATG